MSVSVFCTRFCRYVVDCETGLCFLAKINFNIENPFILSAKKRVRSPCFNCDNNRNRCEVTIRKVVYCTALLAQLVLANDSGLALKLKPIPNM